MISSPNRSRRSGAPVRLVVIHTAEGARDVTSLGRYFQNAAVQASSHVGIDDHGIEQYVPYSEAAWTILSANSISDNAELCGFAAWTRDQWLLEHRPMLELAAQWIAERCAARGIPLRKLTPAQVAQGQAGVIGHIDWTLGMRDGTHTDPGSDFPWDVVMQMAAQAAEPSPSATTAPAPQEDTDMAAIPIRLDTARTFHEAIGAEAGGGSLFAGRGFVTFGSTYGGSTWSVAALAADGKILGYWPQVRTTNNTSQVRELPPGTRCVTVEGAADNEGTRPWASYWPVR